MSDLTSFRDHCRKRAGIETLPERERALFIQLADEIDEYLTAKHAPAVDLFGEVTAEPQAEETA